MARSRGSGAFSSRRPRDQDPRVAQRFVPRAQPLIFRQACQQAAFDLFIELVVDQGDELGVITGHRK
jgi:hypothetical protein